MAEGGAPLSFAQERLWFLDRLEDHGTAYHVPLALRLGGPLVPGVLEQALGEVVRRHEVLRTSLPSNAAGIPRQRVAPAQACRLPRIDLRGLPPALARAVSARLRRAETTRPFDLADGPLLRHLLLPLAADCHDLLLTLHHVVCDAWSLQVLLHELVALCSAFAAGVPSPLSPLAMQYRDFARWQRERLQGQALADELAYWRRHLAAAPAELDLPADPSPRGDVRRRGARLTFAVDAALATRLAALGRRHRAFPFTVYLTAFAALLVRSCRQGEVVLGTTVANRARVALEPLIGLFTNTLALRLDLRGDPPLEQALGRVRAVVMEAQAHQELPFEKLVAELRPERHLRRNPLFQAMFAYQSRAARAPASGRLTVELLPPSPVDAKLPLLLSLEESADGGLAAILEHDADCLGPVAAQQLAHGYLRLLQALVDDPRQRLLAPVLLDAAAQRQVALWGDGGPAADAPPAVPWAVLTQASRTPDAIAVRDGAAILSYAALARRATALAAALRRLGVGPEVAVGVHCDRCLELPVAVLAVTLAGGACVPIDPGYPEARRQLMLADAGVKVVVGPRRLLTDVGIDDGADAGADAGEGLAALELEASVPVAGCSPAPCVTPENLLYVLFTSGSTGRPRGVGFTHRALANLAAWQARAEPAPPRCRTLQFAPASFDVFFQELFTTWTAGGELVLVPDTTRRDPVELLRFLAATGVTRIFLPFVALQQLAEAALAEPGTLRLQQVITAGEQLKVTPALRRLFERLGGAVLRNHYGPTETHVVTSHELEGLPGSWPPLPPIGRPLAGVTVQVVDPALRPVAPGQTGEILLAGVAVARGYLGRPGLTAERFVPAEGASPGSRRYRTGDLGRWGADGRLEYLGRADGQVKVRGVRIELGEVEAALAACAGVRQAAATIQGASAADRRLVGFVVPADLAAPPSPAALRAALRQRLPAALVPSRVALVAALPLTPSGKVDRRALPVAVEEREARRALSRTPIEEVLAGVWEDVLGLEQVAAGDDFFALGGHSLLATQVTSRIGQLFGVELALRELFEAPTLAALAAVIEARRAIGSVEPSPIVAGSKAGAAMAPLSFAQERMWVLDRLQEGGASYNMPAAVRLSGRLQVPALEQALGDVVRRHQVLRTRLVATAEGPRGVMEGKLPLPLALLEMRGAVDSAAVVAEQIAAEAVRSFDLGGRSLLRASLLHSGESEHVFLLTMHHAVSDGWSMGVLSREVAALYEAFAAGRPSPLPELPVQYSDFARWQRRWLDDQRLARELAYWRRALAGAPPVAWLPLDRPRTTPRRAAVGSERFALDRAVTLRLRRLARSSGATLFMTLLAGLAALLHRHGGGDDLVLGSATANRSRPETEGLIGCFANLLALRISLAGDLTFRQLQERARVVAFDAYAHQDLPFERLVQELQPARDLRQHPLVQVVLNLQNFALPSFALAGVQVAAQPVQANVADFDLVFSLSETENGVTGMVGYRRDLFDPPTIARLCDGYADLLHRAAADPDVRILDIPLGSLGPPGAPAASAPAASSVHADAVADFNF